MTEVTVDTKYRRRPWLAAVLTLIQPGLGHIYCGRIVRGLVLAFLAGVCVTVMFVGLASGGWVRAGILTASLLASLTVTIIAVIDAYYVARHTRIDYEPKDYNRWYVYLLLILTVMGTSIGYSRYFALYFRAEYLQPFRVPTVSMYPTVFPGDRLLATKTAYGTSDPQRGDVIVYPNPEDRRVSYIKRVVALPGDTVEIKNDDLYVNGEKLRREELPGSPLGTMKKECQGRIFYEYNGQAKYKIILTAKKGSSVTDMANTTVPKYHCFVLGDNRNMSRDSRDHGPVPIASVKGRFDFIYFPAGNWSRFGKIE